MPEDQPFVPGQRLRHLNPTAVENPQRGTSEDLEQRAGRYLYSSNESAFQKTATY